MNATLCPKCAAEVTSEDLYCPKCGWNLHKAYLPLSKRFRIFGLVCILALPLWYIGWTAQAQLAGTKPTEQFKTLTTPTMSATVRTELSALQSVIEEANDNPVRLWELAQRLQSQIEQHGTPPVQLVRKLTELLERIGEIDPTNVESQLLLADQYFLLRNFEGAERVYAKHLGEHPDDVEVQARYASVLTFLDRFKEALRILEGVLHKNPEDFHALAYTAITYSQMGNVTSAKEFGEKALKVAPTEEARSRFSQFLEALDNQASTASSGVASALEKVLSENPIAGPKFVRVEETSGDLITAYLNDFPIGQMPPAIREKFLARIRDAAQTTDPALAVELRDSETDELLARIDPKPE